MKGKGLGLAGLILGSLACLFALLPIFGPLITTPLAAVGIPLSAVATGRSKNRRLPGYKLALTALLLNIASLPVMVINTVSRW